MASGGGGTPGGLWPGGGTGGPLACGFGGAAIMSCMAAFAGAFAGDWLAFACGGGGVDSPRLDGCANFAGAKGTYVWSSSIYRTVELLANFRRLVLSCIEADFASKYSQYSFESSRRDINDLHVSFGRIEPKLKANY